MYVCRVASPPGGRGGGAGGSTRSGLNQLYEQARLKEGLETEEVRNPLQREKGAEADSGGDSLLGAVGRY